MIIPLRRARDARGRSQLQIVAEMQAYARQHGIEIAQRDSLKAMLSGWENGKRSTDLSEKYRIIFRAIYQSTDEELGFPIPAVEPVQDVRPPMTGPLAHDTHLSGVTLESKRHPWQALSTVKVTDQVTSRELVVTSASATPANGEPWEVAELIRRLRHSEVSSADIELIELHIHNICCAYAYMPSGELLSQIRGWQAHVAGMLDARKTLSQHRDLLASAGWLFLIGGCVEYDMGKRETAELSRRSALEIAREIGHAEIAGWAWEMEAWFALTQGRVSDIISACEAGHRADSVNSVGVQLYAQQAKAYARMGDGKQVRSSLDMGRAWLERLPRPTHPEHHFIIDPDKWDFYEMDAYRILGDDVRASRHALEVVKLGVSSDGTEKSPMRVAEARLTLGVSAARAGELEEAVSFGSQAFESQRKSLPSLLAVARELDGELQHRYPREALTSEFRDHLVTLVEESNRALAP
jgi:transcriptional regulator with XRE-family HTH domain/tetratricopeptide (TPR) repeat protein